MPTLEQRLLALTRKNLSEEERRDWDRAQLAARTGRIGGLTSKGWTKRAKPVKLQQAARDTQLTVYNHKRARRKDEELGLREGTGSGRCMAQGSGSRCWLQRCSAQSLTSQAR